MYKHIEKFSKFEVKFNFKFKVKVTELHTVVYGQKRKKNHIFNFNLVDRMYNLLTIHPP